eukprot:c33206_g1_i1 orf=87-662(+)
MLLAAMGREIKPRPDMSRGWRMLSLQEASTCLEEGLLPQPSVEDLASMLHKCRNERARGFALQLHAYMLKHGLEAYPSLGNYLVSAYVDVGCLHDAELVFDGLMHFNDSLWNSLIIAYAQSGRLRHALSLYHKMRKMDSVYPHAHTYIHLLKACSKLNDLESGMHIHADIARTGVLDRDIFVGCTLVDMYA